MKKLLAILVILCCVLSLVAVMSACEPDNWDNGNLNIVTTIYAEYDWTMNVLGEHADEVNVKYLLNGMDMHSYTGTFKDVYYVTTCDLLVYVGGESDEWVEKALKQSKNDNMIVIKLLDVIDDALHEADGIEGNQDEDDAMDEHVWLSLKRAQVAVNAIAEALATLMPEDADDLQSNATNYCQQLVELDGQYAEVVSSSATDTLVIADRFPFVYLFDDYGLGYYAAFAGCASSTDPNTTTIYALADKLDELNAKVIIITETGSEKVAKGVRDRTKNKNQKILTLNSVQSVSSKDRKKGVTYLSLMKGNLEVLREALQ